MYEIEFSKEAVKHVLVMRKSSPHLFKKLEKLLDELREHPYTGTGHPEQLKFLQGVWSRQLDKKNRIRYIVNETPIVVFIVSALGHYNDNKIQVTIFQNRIFRKNKSNNKAYNPILNKKRRKGVSRPLRPELRK